ncbi:MAG: 50S ribosomal protein L32 [Lachnospiraceae bacterium]|nr:50S ribosomal protein L32 [Lachnospiraceae bacterium]
MSHGVVKYPEKPECSQKEQIECIHRICSKCSKYAGRGAVTST